MNRRTAHRLFCLFFAGGILAAAAVAQESPEDKGLAIAREFERRDAGYGNVSAAMAMILRTEAGKESRREIRVRILEGTGDGDRSLVLFDTPPDVKGTALLTYAHKTGSDDQWLYLPALKRVKRIASTNQSGPFMGSEFAYEDMSPPEVEKYTYRWLRDETYEGMECFVVERYPKDPDSGYTKQVFWLDKQEYRPLLTQYHDRKQSHLKTLTFSDYQRYLDRYWRPGRMEMVNHQTGKSTILLWSNYQFRTDVKESDFDPTALPRLN
jgi:outer membrane lipoprotein-sorting protein